MVARARGLGRVHAVVQNRRFISGVRRLRRLIESGTLGELTSLNCDFFIGAHFGGFREEMDNVLLLDMAIHTLDAARYMSGKTPRAVYCLETNPPGSWYRHGAAANAIFEFDDNVVFNYRGSWAAEGANTSWESAWRIVGTKGTIELENAYEYAGPKKMTIRKDEKIVKIKAYKKVDQFAPELMYFSDCVLRGKEPEPDATEGLNDVRVIRAIIESAESGRPVAVRGDGAHEGPHESQAFHVPGHEEPNLVNVTPSH